MHGCQRCVTGALNAMGQWHPALPHGAAVPAAAPPFLLLFLADISFSWRFMVRSALSLLRLPCWAAAGRSMRASPGTASPCPRAPLCRGALPHPVSARAWALPRVPAHVPGLSRERHRPRQVVLREEEPSPIPRQGQGLPCAASHRRGQEVSGPGTMGLCAVSVLLSTDLVQFCTVFSLLGQLRIHGQRLPPRPQGAPAAALARALAVGGMGTPCPMVAGHKCVSVGPELG